MAVSNDPHIKDVSLNQQRQELADFLRSEWVRFWNDDSSSVDYQKRRSEWAKFWIGHQFGDIDLIHRVWGDTDEKNDEMTINIMKNMDFETVCFVDVRMQRMRVISHPLMAQIFDSGEVEFTDLAEVFILRVWKAKGNAEKLYVESMHRNMDALH